MGNQALYGIIMTGNIALFVFIHFYPFKWWVDRSVDKQVFSTDYAKYTGFFNLK